MRVITASTILLLISLSLFSQQDSTTLVKYDYSFSFNEGIYLDFESFKNNNPIGFERLSYPPYGHEFFYGILDTARFIVYNGQYGEAISLPVYNIWGYCKNGKPYIYWADKFNLIPFVGQASHFITTVKVLYSNYYDPFYDPYSYNPTARTYQSDELRQFIIDMKSGKIIDYNLKNVEQILKRDSQTYNEFMKLGKRKRAKQMFIYLRLFNERNPLYIPE